MFGGLKTKVQKEIENLKIVLPLSDWLFTFLNRALEISSGLCCSLSHKNRLVIRSIALKACYVNSDLKIHR